MTLIGRYFSYSSRFECGIMKYVAGFASQSVKERIAKKTEMHKIIKDMAKRVQEDTEML